MSAIVGFIEIVRPNSEPVCGLESLPFSFGSAFTLFDRASAGLSGECVVVGARDPLTLVVGALRRKGNMRRLVLILGLIFLAAGCDGNGGGNGGGGFAAVDVTGQWSILATSTASTPRLYLETNLTSQSSDTVFAAPSNVIVVHGTEDPSNSETTDIQGFGGQCDAGQLGDDSVTAKFSNPTQATLTFSENGPGGKVIGTGTITFDSTGTVLIGDYSFPTACGQAADSGTLQGSKQPPFSGPYSGTSSSGNLTSVDMVESASYSLSVTGTDSGGPVLLSGTAVGAAFSVSGLDRGSNVDYVGFCPGELVCFIYRPNFDFVALLAQGNNPAAAVLYDGKIAGLRGTPNVTE